MKNRWLTAVTAGVVFVIFFSACSSDITYHPGVVTTAIWGHLDFPKDSLVGSPFVIVLRHHHTWLESASPKARISVDIIQPDEAGDYRVMFGNDTRQVDLFYILRQHTLKSASFKRTLGVDEYERDMGFSWDEHWKENYFVLLKPSLVGYLVEDRYQLNKIDQQFLVGWIDETEKQIP